MQISSTTLPSPPGNIGWRNALTYRLKAIGRRLLSTVALALPLAFALQSAAWGANFRLAALCGGFNTLNSRIRDGRVAKEQAQEQLGKLIGQIRSEYYASGGPDYPESTWVFPVQGYDVKAIGGIGDKDYQLGGYDYLDGNRHAGHPSLDIFIRDRHQRGLDDRTGQPVQVLSITGGVVVALEKQWDPACDLRGGKYVWIYDPAAAVLVYYAHNSEVLVEVGDLVRPGDILARVGRTGKNAWPRRSPTHLHLTCLSLATGRPVPRNIYRELVGSRSLL